MMRSRRFTLTRNNVAEIHTQYGGVVPELASRYYQQNMVPLSIALKSKH
jgi:tRNA A37 threonylcarbamoyltransferase TsaD